MNPYFEKLDDIYTTFALKDLKKKKKKEKKCSHFVVICQSCIYLQLN